MELLVISWQRTPSPGLTVKGGKNLLHALHSAQACARVGEGVPRAWVCDEKLLPPTGPALKFSLKPERSPKPVSTTETLRSRETHSCFLLFNLSAFEKQIAKFISGHLTFAKMISIDSNGSLLGQD